MPKIYKHNIVGTHCTFYEQKCPHIIELVIRDNSISTKIWNDIKLFIDSNKYDSDSQEFYNHEYGFFNKVIFYNDKQCSGELLINVSLDDSDTFNLEEDYSTIDAKKLEGVWNINDFRNNVVINTKPFFVKDWDSIKDQFPIDKVINGINYGTEEEPQYVIDNDKLWNNQERFRDKFLVIRLITDNVDETIQLITSYISTKIIESKR